MINSKPNPIQKPTKTEGTYLNGLITPSDTSGPLYLIGEINTSESFLQKTVPVGGITRVIGSCCKGSERSNPTPLNPPQGSIFTHADVVGHAQTVLGLVAFAFSLLAQTLNSKEGVASLEESHARPENRQKPLEVSRSHELCGGAHTRSQTPASHDQAKAHVPDEPTAVQPYPGLLVRSPQADAPAEVYPPSNPRDIPLAVPRQVRPLTILKAYWSDLAPEENALWHEPYYSEAA